jgi:hypothetical protein
VDKLPRWVVMWGKTVDKCHVYSFEAQNPKSVIEQIKLLGNTVYYFAKCKEVQNV